MICAASEGFPIADLVDLEQALRSMDMTVGVRAFEYSQHHGHEPTVPGPSNLTGQTTTVLVIGLCVELRGQVCDDLAALPADGQTFRRVHGWPELRALKALSQDGQALGASRLIQRNPV